MKHLVFLAVLTLAATVGVWRDAFWAVLLYYGLAVLRPQYLWEWSLPVHVRWSLIAAGLVLAGALLHGRELLARARPTLLTGLLLAYGLLVTLSSMLADNPQVAQSWAEEYGKVLLMALLTSLIVQLLWQVRALTLVVLGCLLYLAWDVNYLYFFCGRRLDIFHQGYGGMDRNGAALMLALGLPLVYGFGMSLARLWQRAAVWLGGLIVVHSLMLTYSRGAMLASMGGIVWLLAHHRPRRQAVAVAAVLLVAVAVLAGPAVQQRFLSISAYHTDVSAQGRLAAWSAAWEMAWEDPLLGKGIRNADLYSANYGTDSTGRAIHSQYLQIAADTGIPAAAIYLAMLGLSWAGYRRSRRLCQDALDAPLRPGRPSPSPLIEQTLHLSLALEASLVTFLGGAVFLSMEVAELPWLLVVLGGVLPAAVEHERSEHRRSGPREAEAPPIQPAPPRRHRAGPVPGFWPAPRLQPQETHST